MDLNKQSYFILIKASCILILTFLSLDKIEAKKSSWKVRSISETFAPTSSSTECKNPSDDPKYGNMIPLKEDRKLVFYYEFVDNRTSLSVKLVYHGIGWLSWAIAPNFMGLMIGSEAVIGLPAEEMNEYNPGKYSLTDIDIGGVTLMPGASQTLKNASVVQDEYSTNLTFTKLIKEADELSINPDGTNTFSWAIGMDNRLGFHAERAPFQIDLSQSCSSSSVVIEESRTVPVSFWKAHGLLAALAWGVFTPLSVMSSWFRDFLKGRWMKIHMYLNMAACIFSLSALFVAVTAYSKAGKQHFQGAHQILGLFISIFVVMQLVGGILRPPNVPEKKSRKRLFWEFGHKIVGYFVLFASIWEINSGLKLYVSRYGGETKLVFVYWGWLIALIVFSSMLYSKNKLFNRN